MSAFGTKRHHGDVRFVPKFVTNLAAVVGPVKQSLALPRSTCRVAALAVRLDLCDVPPDGLPSFNLADILLRDAPPHVITAVPLKPASRIVGIDPAFLAPDRERLAGINSDIVQRAVAT